MTTRQYLFDLLYAHHSIKIDSSLNESRFLESEYARIVTYNALETIYKQIKDLHDAHFQKRVMNDLFFSYVLLREGSLDDPDLLELKKGDITYLYNRFLQDEDFALTLVDAYFQSITISNNDVAILSTKKETLDLAFKFNAVQITLLDDILNEKFLSILHFFEERKMPLLITSAIMSLGIFYSISIDAPSYIEDSFNYLVAYRGYLIKMMHAEVYAMQLEGNLVVDSNFRRDFDEHLAEDDYNVPWDKEYTQKLLAYYVEALKLKEKFPLKDELKTRVRQINPLYY